MPSGLDPAIAQARFSGRVVCAFVFAGASGGGGGGARRGDLWARTWLAPRVQSWLAGHSIPVVLDGDQHRAVVEEHSILEFPTILFIGPDRCTRGRITGPCSPESFLEYAEGCIRSDSEREAQGALPGDEQDTRKRAQPAGDSWGREISTEAAWAALESWDGQDLNGKARKDLARSSREEIIDALCAMGSYEEIASTWGPLSGWIDESVGTYKDLKQASGGQFREEYGRLRMEALTTDLARAHRVALGVGASAVAIRARAAAAAVAAPAEAWNLLLLEAARSHNWSGLEEAGRHVLELLGTGELFQRVIELEESNPPFQNPWIGTAIELGSEEGLRAEARRGPPAREPLLSISLRRLSYGGPYVLATPPIVKAAREAPQLVPVLLELGTEIDAAEHPTGITPLHVAVETGNVELVRALLEQGSSCEVADAEGSTALDKAANDEVRSLLRDALRPYGSGEPFDA